MDVARGRHKWQWAGVVLAAAALVVVSAAGSAAGAVIAGPGFKGDVRTAVEPSRFPAQGSAPATVTVEGSISGTEPSGFPPTLRTITLVLDRQLAINTAGLPTCKPADLRSRALAQARQRCKDALVGTGVVTGRILEPGASPYDLHNQVLLFNGAASRLLMYAYMPPPLGPAAIVASGAASGRTLEIPLPKDAGVPTSFQFRLGKTWRSKGENHGYLNGRCSTGTIRNNVTLALVNQRTGTKSNVSDATPQRCTAS